METPDVSRTVAGLMVPMPEAPLTRIAEPTPVWSRRREHRAKPLGVVDSLPVEWIVADDNGRLGWNDDEITSSWIGQA
jgi:hypothetical protein